MSDNKEKEFSICQKFNYIDKLSEEGLIDGDIVKRFGVNWKIQLGKYASGNIFPNLSCESSETGDWSINVTCDVIIGGKPFETGLEHKFKQNKTETSLSYIQRRDFLEFGLDESTIVECHVKIHEMTGIPEKLKSMNFDDDVAKEASDVTLMVGDQEFCVFKNYLSLHSTYFKSLFSGNFSEAEKSIIELKDIDPDDFQDFLEILYAASPIENDTLLGVLKLADFFDAKIVVRRCEEFLMNHSKETLKSKFQLAVQYKLTELKKKCFAEMTKKTNFEDFLPENATDFDAELWQELFKKAISLN
ncbi:unnamed protein product [Caenorhabditis nigoni]